MEVVRGFDNISNDIPAIVTVGSFDGLHLGHQRILRQMRDVNRGRITVVTFDPHPQSVVRPDLTPPPQLTSFGERIDLFRKYGVERLTLLPFTKEFAALEAEDYVRSILLGRLNARVLFVGPNHQFGRGRRGDVNLLLELGRREGFEVRVVDSVVRGGEVVSSSRIRRKLLAGDFERGIQFLSRPYYISGVVVRGEGRGRKLGYPTANFEGWETGKLIPPHGIYATVAEVRGVRYLGVSHFGPRPTFTGSPPAIETHILDFDEDIYGETIRVGLVRKLRDIVAFASGSALIEQMNIDRRAAAVCLSDAGFKRETRRKDRRLGLILT